MITGQVYAIARKTVVKNGINVGTRLGTSHILSSEPPKVDGRYVYRTALCGQRVYSNHEVFLAYPNQVECERCRG